MRKSQIETGIKSSIFCCAFFILSACGGSAGNTDGITIGVTPSTSYLLPGSHSNCNDAAGYKAGYVTNPAQGEAVGESVSELRMSFPRFTVEWNKKDTLFVAYVRVTVRSSYLATNPFVYEVSGDELDGLMGRAQSAGYAGGSDMQSSIGGVSKPTPNRIDSDDPARDCDTSAGSGTAFYPPPLHTCNIAAVFSHIYTPNYGECGLDIGGISLSVGSTSSTGGSGSGSGSSNSGQLPTGAPSFGAGATIELIGYSEDANYNQSPVQATTSATLTYVSGN